MYVFNCKCIVCVCVFVCTNGICQLWLNTDIFHMCVYVFVWTIICMLCLIRIYYICMCILVYNLYMRFVFISKCIAYVCLFSYIHRICHSLCLMAIILHMYPYSCIQIVYVICVKLQIYCICVCVLLYKLHMSCVPKLQAYSACRCMFVYKLFLSCVINCTHIAHVSIFPYTDCICRECRIENISHMFVYRFYKSCTYHLCLSASILHNYV